MILEWAHDRGHLVSTTAFYEAHPAIPDISKYDFLVIMGGPMSVNDEAVYSWLAPEKTHIQAAINAGKPILGICLGAQLIANSLGAKVYPNTVKEIGWFPVTIKDSAREHPIAKLLEASPTALHWHGETFDLPKGALHLLSSEVCKHQAFLVKDRVLGLQFHFEMADADIKNILTHCADELVPSATIQSADKIAEQKAFIPHCRRALFNILDYLSSFC